MTVNFNNIVKIMSIIFLVLGCSIIPALLVAYAYGEDASVIGFANTFLLALSIGLVFHKMYQPEPLRLKERDGYLIVTLCWISISLLGALPYWISGAVPNLVDAFFESCSGFSTTGATVLLDVESMPKSLLFWRSFTHWLGGMGIILFATTFLPSSGIGGQKNVNKESYGPTISKRDHLFSDMTQNIFLLYLLFTISEALLLMLGGMNLFDAATHSFSTVGTGGFSPYNDNIDHFDLRFDTSYIQWVIIIFMILSGMNFNLYFLAFKKGLKSLLKDSEFKFYGLLITVISVLIFLSIYFGGYYGKAGRAFTDAVFQTVSFITTTGFHTCNYDLWPTFCKVLLLFLMISGACTVSIGGGVKLIRVLVALKMVRRGVSLKLHPNRYIPVTIGSREIPQEAATNVANYIFLYIFVIFFGAALISIDGNDLMTTLSSVISCVSNVGLGFNQVGPGMPFAFYSDFSKMVLSFLMIAGRLELFSFFMLFSSHYWNANKV